MDESLLLVQTDTTVGFCSKSATRIDAAKQRPANKPYLKTLSHLRLLKQRTRVPEPFKNMVRRAKKTTFIIQNQAFRVVSAGAYHDTLNYFEGELLSSSANLSGKTYDVHHARKSADIIIETADGLFESTPSRIIKLTQHLKKRVR